MREENKFNILEIDKERKYLEDKAKRGHILVKVDEEGYVFQEGSEMDVDVVIEYFYNNPLNFAQYYRNQGLELVSSYKGKRGYWNYYLGPKNQDLQIRKDDYNEFLDSTKNRADIFWSIIVVSLGTFSSYMFIRTSSYLFLILLAICIVFFIWLQLLKKKIKKAKGGEE